MGNTTDALPDPPVPAWADLRRFPNMPLPVQWLRDAPFTFTVSGDEFRAGLVLMGAAWHQLPAGSLPDDDGLLSRLAGYGLAVREWRRVRSGALSGWRKHSDRRLYHAIVSERVLSAVDEQSRFAWRKECDRLRKANSRNKTDVPLPSLEAFSEAFRNSAVGPAPEGEPAQDDEEGNMSSGHPQRVRRTDPENPQENALKGKERKGKDSTTEASPLPPEPAPAIPPSLWGQGLTTLRQLTGRSEAACRQLVGKWRKILGDDDATLFGLIAEVQTLGIADPVPWLEKAIALRTGRAKPAARQSNLAWQAAELRAQASRDDEPFTIDGTFSAEVH